MDLTPYLDAATKADILRQRLQQFALEAYQHELNRETAKLLGDDALVAQADAALATLKVAIETHENELNSL